MSQPLVSGLHALQLMALFVAGNLIVATVAHLVRRLLHREPSLALRREAVFEINQKPLRIESAQSELAASKVERSGAHVRSAKLREKIALRVPLDDPPSTKFAYGLLGIILGEGEAVVFLLLTAPAMLFGLPPELWALAAPPISAVGVLMLHVIAGHFITDKHRPARTIRRAKIAAGICGTAVVFAIWAVLSGRNLSDAALVEQIVGAGLMTLAALLSITAAMCTMVASTLFEAEQEEHELVRLESLTNEYDRHIELLERDLARLTTSPDAPPDSSTAISKDQTVPAPPAGDVADIPVHQTPGDPVTAASGKGLGGRMYGSIPRALVLVLAVGLAAAAQGQTPERMSSTSTPRMETNNVSVPAFARRHACEWLIDITKSEDRTWLQATLAEIGTKVPLASKAMECTTIRLTPFAGDLFASIVEFVLPPEDTSGSCNPGQSLKAESARAQAIRFMYPAVEASRRRDSLQLCGEKRESYRRSLAGTRNVVFAQLGDTLQAIGNLNQRGPCTALPQAVDRALVRSQSVVVVTDGVPTCTPPPTTIRVPVDARLIFLLVPPGEPGNYDRANMLLERLAALEKLYPGSRALIAPEATPEFWRHLRKDWP